VVCDLNQKASPSPLTIRLMELGSLNVHVCWKFLHFASATFSLGDLFDEPLFGFWGCHFFHQRSFLMSPIAFFEVPSFFIKRLF
jgi:hypothetical protein